MTFDVGSFVLSNFICNMDYQFQAALSGQTRFPVTTGRSGAPVVRVRPTIRIPRAARDRALRADSVWSHPSSAPTSTSVVTSSNDPADELATVLRFHGKVRKVDNVELPKSNVRQLHTALGHIPAQRTDHYGDL